MTDPVYDAIIVGSGAGGGTAARALTDRGWRVAVLEKGPARAAEDFLPLDELHFRSHRNLTPSAATDPQTYVVPRSDGEVRTQHRWWIANMVGGSTMLWQATVPRYTEEDFKVSQLIELPGDGSSMVDWPWTYDEFQPHFERAEREWGVSGQTGVSPAQEPVRPGYRFPLPPLRPHAMTRFLTQRLAPFGWTPYPAPTAINSRTYDGRPGCPFCGFCQFFACAVNDRASSTNTVLAKALHTGLCDLRANHCVTGIVHERKDDRLRAVGVRFVTEPGGPESVLQAPVIIVAVQAIESARLFLHSEIPDPNGLVGRYLTYHTKGSVSFRFDGVEPWDEGPEGTYQPRTAIPSLQLRDLYVIDDPERRDLRKGGKFTISDGLTTGTPVETVESTGKWGSALVEEIEDMRSRPGVTFQLTGEAVSHYDNRVELDPDITDPWGVPVARTYYRHHDYDIALSQYALDKVANALGNNGGSVVDMLPQGMENSGYGHNHGCLRAGADPGASVLDTQCQSQTVAGLYVLDAAWMPTAGASNPTLTVIANAFRVCEQIPSPGR